MKKDECEKEEEEPEGNRQTFIVFFGLKRKYYFAMVVSKGGKIDRTKD